ncbi:hypothetical protein H0H81_001816 [Sphagnurus paluster]|uniref:3-oxoacyl-[acyl-carrier-protein] reductase n=1 Tax=Sphagnurus paluster TaxID=117069 RepID=A0A9P7KK06_9AGAR|nr:hypothetical protein H0H81_001816 [Sphagnurus paluster]
MLPSSKLDLLATGICGVVKFVATASFSSSSLWAGALLIISSCGMGALFIIGAILKAHPHVAAEAGEDVNPPPAGKAMAAMLYICVCFRQLSAGGAPLFIDTEVKICGHACYRTTCYDGLSNLPFVAQDRATYAIQSTLFREITQVLMSIEAPSLGVAHVTGASRGIGRGIALRLAKDGYDIGINGRSTAAESLEKLEKEIIALGRRACIAFGDVSVPADVENMVATVVENLGELNIVSRAAHVVVFPLGL